MESTMHSLG